MKSNFCIFQKFINNLKRCRVKLSRSNMKFSLIDKQAIFHYIR